MKVIKMHNNDFEVKWKKVYTTQKPIEADIVQGSLENDGIRVVQINKRDSSYTVFGEIELYVAEEEYDLAIRVISGISPLQ
jgi:hypothetical protein